MLAREPAAAAHGFPQESRGQHDDALLATTTLTNSRHRHALTNGNNLRQYRLKGGGDIMKHSWLFLGALVLAGCSQTASPTFDGGHYFMTGDANCTQYRLHKSGMQIACANASGQITGYRAPMTDQQLYVYQSNQAIAAQQNAAVSAQIAANNAAINAQTANTLQSVRRNAGFN